METLPCGNGWKLMTTGGAAQAQVLDFCPLTTVQVTDWEGLVSEMTYNMSMGTLNLLTHSFTHSSFDVM